MGEITHIGSYAPLAKLTRSIWVNDLEHPWAGIVLANDEATLDQEVEMEWTKPEFVELSMDAEIGRYQQEDNGL